MRFFGYWGHWTGTKLSQAECTQTTLKTYPVCWCDSSRQCCGDCHRVMVGGYGQRNHISHLLWVQLGTDIAAMCRPDAHRSIQCRGSCGTQTSLLAPRLRKVMDFPPPPASLGSVWFQGGQLNFSQACSPTHFQGRERTIAWVV